MDAERSLTTVYRLFHALFAIVLLGIAGSDAVSWGALACRAPANVLLTLGAAALSFVATFFYLSNIYPLKTYAARHVWFPVSHLTLDAIFAALWIAAADDPHAVFEKAVEAFRGLASGLLRTAR